jgi:transcriptional regulator with XRE-family HTH domain
MNNTVEAKLNKIILNIRAVRHYRNYSQDYVASKIGVTQHGYSKIENGVSILSVEKLFSIANVLEVTVSDLMDLNIKKLKSVHFPMMRVV